MSFIPKTAFFGCLISSRLGSALLQYPQNPRAITKQTSPSTVFTLNAHLSTNPPKTSYANPSNNDEGLRFQYSKASLNHLKAIELPVENKNTWSNQKSIALVGAFTSSLVLSLAINYFWPGAAFFFSGLGAMVGWYLCGGAEVREQDKPKNGGSDGKLVLDRPSRLHRILEDMPSDVPIIQSKNSDNLNFEELERLAKLVHTDEYINLLRSTSETSGNLDRPIRLVPTYARTLVDSNSYIAALSAVNDWILSVDAAMLPSDQIGKQPLFALVRPPGHHACRSTGMGGCLLNSAAIAAMYALEKGAKRVAILDVDAHHGNGIAHCVQDETRIRYVSLHEDPTVFGSRAYAGRKERTDSDPRGPEKEDRGPLGNCYNVVLPPKVGWKSGYRDALEKEAIPWLLGENGTSDEAPDVVLVAVGFDALEKDSSSSFTLKPEDYAEMSSILQTHFGNRLAFGLEGGYSWINGELSHAVQQFAKPWKRSNPEL